MTKRKPHPRTKTVKYTGPARPVSLDFHAFQHDWVDTAVRVVFLIALIVIALDLLVWRPN